LNGRRSETARDEGPTGVTTGPRRGREEAARASWPRQVTACSPGRANTIGGPAPRT